MIQKEFLNHEDFVGKVQILTPKETYTVDYPQAVKAAEEQESIIWFARELGVEKDVGDIRTQCTAGERHGITTTLKLFTNYELSLGGDEFWGGKIGKMFPRPDIQRMAATFAYIELGVHAPFYSLINESLNIAKDEFYLSWKEVPELVSRMEFVDHFANSKDPLLTTAAFTFLEGVVLFSNFAFLKSFGSGGFNLIPHITAGIDASAKDEHYHAMASAWLYNQTKKEMVEAGVLAEQDVSRYEEVIYQIAEQVYEHEKAIADIIFEQGGIRTVTKENILHFVRNRVDVMLEMLEIPPLFGDERGVVSEWFYNQLSSYKYSDFFHAQQIQYVRTWAKHKLTFRPYMAGEV